MVVYNGMLIGSTAQGERDQKIINPFSPSTIITLFPDGTLNGFTSIIPYGFRVTSRLGYIPVQVRGTRVSSPLISNPAEFVILQEEGLGTLFSGYSSDGIYIVDSSIGEIIRDVDLGVSTVGIGYQPDTIISEQQSVRRWPREWHGDNMKN